VESIVLTRCQHFIRPEKEVAEHKATFLDAIKGLKAARKYIHQLDIKNSITVICKKVELYRLRAQGEKKQTTDW
jgi:hypothetical protein